MNKSEVLENIRGQIGKESLFLKNSFKRGNCSVGLTGVSENERVVVDLDKVFPHGQQSKSQCECIIFYFDSSERLVVVAIELKGGKNAEADKAVMQLKSGAAYAASFVSSGIKTIFIPILYHNHLSRAEIRHLRKIKSQISFQGISSEIITARCGGKLSKILQKKLLS